MIALLIKTEDIALFVTGHYALLMHEVIDEVRI